MEFDEVLEAQTEAKQSAVEALNEAIASIATEDREPSRWERHCLVFGLGALSRGAYDLAEVEGVLAMTPAKARIADDQIPADPMTTGCTLAVLQRALRTLIREPVIRYPALGSMR